MTDIAAIRETVTPIARRHGVKRAYLFGSRARGDNDWTATRNGAVYRNALSMPLLQIGELAKNLSDEFRADHSEIPWRDTMRMRDLFGRHYGAVDYEQTWDTSHSSVAELKRCLEMTGQ